ncbi:MAG: ATP-dependent DNA helicase RecG [Trueperaceae bacterium]
MATKEQLRQRLMRPLRQELNDGCRDRVVVGGIESLIITVGAPFAEVRALFGGYADLDEEQRRHRVDEALRRLEAAAPDRSDDAPRDAPGSADDRPSTARPAGPRSGSARSAGAVEALLDAELRSGAVALAAQAPRRLLEAGIATYRDLLHAWPRRYEDRRALPDFRSLAGREAATVLGTLLGRKGARSGRGLHVLRGFVRDARGDRLTLVWFNQPWLEDQLFPGRTVIASGRVKERAGRSELHVAHHELVEGDDRLSTDRIVGLYRVPRGTSQDYLRRAVHVLLDALPTVPDHLPRALLQRENLMPLDRAVRQAHLPDDEEALAAALQRLRFDEFLFLELRMLRTRRAEGGGRAVHVDPGELRTFEAELPFALTGAQRRAIEEVTTDLRAPKQMARMLQGDVGSGKTAVAAAAAWLVIRAGRQAALMAPTEILARQHYESLRAYLHPLGVRSDLLIGAQPAAVRRDALARIASGGVDLVVGTHALIQKAVTFRDLGLAVVDEEHRFGVDQRRALLRDLPDVLVMSATPIPRSLALTAYGDLDLSVLDELPPGRTPVRTELVNAKQRLRVYRELTSEIRAGRQAFVVAPLIDPSEAETMQEIASATAMADDLRAMLPSDVRIELLHGRMSAQEKEETMRRFRDREADLLVATTVIEVGVDVPNASVMVIENAERFGLAQLHQLRGRVGRGAAESRCILIAGDRSRSTQRRLQVIEKHTDGFLIAEKDLELRGPGEMRGTRQSGLPDLELGDLVRDGDLIERARALAITMLDADPELHAPWARRLRRELERRVHALGVRQVI